MYKAIPYFFNGVSASFFLIMTGFLIGFIGGFAGGVAGGFAVVLMVVVFGFFGGVETVLALFSSDIIDSWRCLYEKDY